MTDLPGDPNWLLATVAQSAAIIVGLLGFFMLSRRASFLSEQRSLRIRLRQIDLALSSRAARPEAYAETESGQGRHLAADDIEALHEERRMLDQELSLLGTAPGGVISLLVLAYFAAVGILFPLILMPARTAAFDPGTVWSVGGLQLSGPGWKRLVVGGFASGLLIVLAQIFLNTFKSRPLGRDPQLTDSNP